VFRKVLRLVARVARTPSTTVLILGESGTGKELVARAIHQASDRAGKPFVALNCAAISESLLEAELFGYEKGAFTGALREGKHGLFEAARGGTVFLDEIGEMPVALQAKLLRVLQEKSFKRVGGVEDVEVDTRVIASTNRNLEDAIARGEFRDDLYYRLSVMPIHLPPLRDRIDDIPLLARYFLEKFNVEHQRCIQEFSPESMEALQSHDWPGSVRELRNTVERAVIQTPGTIIQECHLGLFRPSGTPRGEWVLELEDPSIRTAERALIEQVLRRSRWNISRTARILGINRSTLYSKIRDYEIPQPADV
jgi:transcriptional regulator with PAS, ATPase and Fis domain